MARFVREVGKVWHVKKELPPGVVRDFELSACGVVFGGAWKRNKKFEVADELPADARRCSGRGCSEAFARTGR